jgi:DNA ligase 1
MQKFAQTYYELNLCSTKAQQIDVLCSYLSGLERMELAIALSLLMNKKVSVKLPQEQLRQHAMEAAGIPEWLMQQSEAMVGDLCEAISCILPTAMPSESPITLQDLHTLVNETNLDWHQTLLVTAFWAKADRKSCYVLNKIITGGKLVMPHARTLAAALSNAMSITKNCAYQCLMSDWIFGDTTLVDRLLAPSQSMDMQPKFTEITPIADAAELINRGTSFIAHQHLGGKPAQLHRVGQQTTLYNTEGEMLNYQFPDLIAAAQHLPAAIALEGELVLMEGASIEAGTSLSKRYDGYKPTAANLKKYKSVMCCWDVLSMDNKSLLDLTYHDRWSILQEILAIQHSFISAFVGSFSPQTSQDMVQVSKQLLKSNMLVHKATTTVGNDIATSAYLLSKSERVFKAVLLYAQPMASSVGTGHTELSFAIWHSKQLVPIGKAQNSLPEAQMLVLNKWIKANTKEKFGPVRSLKAELVFEVSCTEVAVSAKRKSGIAVSNLRIRNWLRDAHIDSAATQTELLAGTPT